MVRDEAALSAIEAEEVLKTEAELPTVNKSQNAAPRYNGNMHQIRMQEKIENYSATQKVASMQISRMRFYFPSYQIICYITKRPSENHEFMVSDGLFIKPCFNGLHARG